MAALFSFACLFVAAFHVSGTLGFLDFEDYVIPVDRIERRLLKYPPLQPWDREILRHRLDPKWLFLRRFRYDNDYNNARYEPAAGWVSSEETSASNTEKLGSVKARQKYLDKAIPTRNVDYTWNKKDGTGGHPQGLRQSVFRSRLNEGAGAVPLDGDRRRVVLTKNSRVQPLMVKTFQQDEVGENGLKQSSTDGEGETTYLEENSTTIGSNEEMDHSESDMVANRNGTSGEESDTTSVEDTVTTEAVQETATSSIHDKEEEDDDTHTVDDRISERISISKSSFPATKGTVKETAVTVHSTGDHSSPKEISFSTTTFPSSADTVSETMPPTPSTAGDSSSKRVSPSMTPSTSSAGPESETVSPTPSTVGDRSSKGISSVVTVSETTSPTPPTTGGISSTSTTVPDHVIVLPRIRTARIVLSTLLVVIAVVAVAITAVCIFRERRRKLKYDQLKLLP